MYPTDFFLTGSSPDSLEPKAEYKTRLYNIVAWLDGSSPLELKDTDTKEKFFRPIKSIKFRMNLTNLGIQKANKLNDISNLREFLLKEVFNSINRIVRNIRNEGMLPNLIEIRDFRGEWDYYKTKFQIQVIRNDGNVEDAPTIRPISSFPPYSGGEKPLNLSVSSWIDIQNGIEKDTPTLLEMEFFVNAMEHMRKFNFKYAILESIIGLEISVHRYLYYHYQKIKNMPEQDIKGFLGPGTPLKNRVSVLLRANLPQHVVEKIDFPSVISAINLRNKIMHNEGKIPKNFSEDQIIDMIYKVIGLSLKIKIENLKLGSY